MEEAGHMMRTLFEIFNEHILRLTCSRYGCRVVQKIIVTFPIEMVSAFRTGLLCAGLHKSCYDANGWRNLYDLQSQSNSRESSGSPLLSGCSGCCTAPLRAVTSDVLSCWP